MSAVTEMPITIDDYEIAAGGGRASVEFVEDTYILTLARIVDFAPSKYGYDGKEPENQFTLEFTVDDFVDPETGETWTNPKTGEAMTVRGYYTPKIYAIKGYPEPKLYLLLKALNGGVPVEVPIDDDGEPLPYRVSYVRDLIAGFIGTSIRQTLEPNERGFPRMKKQSAPLPLRRRPAATATKVVSIVRPEEADEAVEENF
jgi:hypothetical protein